MNSSRNKKLLASSLTALSLSANSLNVSAKDFINIKNEQIRENVRYCFRHFGAKGKKCDERQELDKLFLEMDKFIEFQQGSYFCICNKLYKSFKNFLSRREEKKYTSSISGKLKNIINNYQKIENRRNSKELKKWLELIVEELRGTSPFSILSSARYHIGKLSKLSIDEEYQKHGKLKRCWSTENNGIECYLYEDGYLVVQGNEENDLGSDTLGSDIKEYVKNVSIEGKITSIGSKAFENCQNLTSIEIPRSVKFIASHAFKDCISLKNIQISKSVKNIEDSAFDGCNNNLICVKVSKDSSIKDRIKEILPKAEIQTFQEFPVELLRIGSFVIKGYKRI